MSRASFETRCEVAKVDETLGLVMGFGIVCTEKGEPYFDLQGDHIPEDAMLKAATEFMVSERVQGDMHARDGESAVRDGTVVFAFPLTADVAKAFGIETERTGLMVAIRPSEAVLSKFRDGTYTGFSIGGLRGEDEEVD